MSAPFIPDSAPFTAEQRAWLNGFLAGIFSRSGAPGISNLRSPISDSTPQALVPLTILFGSQTGTAEGLAKRAAKEAGKRGYAATILDMAQTDAAKLSAEKSLLIITSTYGDGEPPDNAKSLHTALASETAASLTNVRFSVCSLGDTNYTQFCRCGQDFDLFLEKRGATRVAPRVDCDLEYEEKFLAWLNAALSALNAAAAPSLSAAATAPADTADAHDSPGGYTRQNPFPASVLTVRPLNGAGSAKEVNHVEFSLEGSGLSYEAGDALGVWPQNCPQLVGEVLTVLGRDGEEAVATAAGEQPLRNALLTTFDLGKPTPEMLALLAAVPAGPGTANLKSEISNSGLQSGGLQSEISDLKSTSAPVLDVLDVLTALPVKPAPVEFVARLKKLQPRLYSISSSPRAHPGQVHLTVGAVRYESAGRARKGVCSTFLAERALAAGKTGVFVHSNKAFRPPASGDTPMIMVGPGTGIAPFRAFLEERFASGAKGKNWLFFGDQREGSDFLYREELLALKTSGALTRLDLAWSRDQTAKIYVQNRMLENATELYAWLEAGAHFYVCGDASRMAKDVDAALHSIVEKAGGMTAVAAADYVNALKVAKRYQRDVY